MLKRILLLTISLNIAFISHSIGQESETAVSFRIVGEPSFSITGSSNVRDWSADTKNMEGSIVAGPNFAAWISDGSMPENNSDTGSGWFEEVNFAIVSTDLDSGISAMNNTLYNNLKAEEHEKIHYRLTEVMEVRQGDSADDLVLLVSGIANAAGVDHPLEHEVTVTRDSADNLSISGELQMKITDFNIDPPTFMRGALVTEDRVDVAYHFNMETGK